MLKQLSELVRKDELILHKAGLFVGSIFGIMIGLIVSERADAFENNELSALLQQEETLDGETTAD